MQERQVTVEGRTFPLPPPFHVLATANPVEYEGTYPLPEAQLDRFLLRVGFGYPTAEEEYDVLRTRIARQREEVVLDPVTDAAGLLEMQAAVEEVEVDRSVGEYCVALVTASREPPRRADRRLTARVAGPDAVRPGAGGDLRTRLRAPRGRQDGGARRARPPDHREARAVDDRRVRRRAWSPALLATRADARRPARRPDAGDRPADERAGASPAALVRATAIAAVVTLAAVALGRPDLLVLAAPFGLLCALAIAHAPRGRVSDAGAGRRPLAARGTEHPARRSPSSRRAGPRAGDRDPRRRRRSSSPSPPSGRGRGHAPRRGQDPASSSPSARAAGAVRSTGHRRCSRPPAPGAATAGVRSDCPRPRWSPSPRPAPSRSGETPHPVGLIGQNRSRRGGDGSEFFAIRPFQPGDRLRRVNWRTTLRTGRGARGRHHRPGGQLGADPGRRGHRRRAPAAGSTARRAPST